MAQPLDPWDEIVASSTGTHSPPLLPSNSSSSSPSSSLRPTATTTTTTTTDEETKDGLTFDTSSSSALPNTTVNNNPNLNPPLPPIHIPNKMDSVPPRKSSTASSTTRTVNFATERDIEIYPTFPSSLPHPPYPSSASSSSSSSSSLPTAPILSLPSTASSSNAYRKLLSPSTPSVSSPSSSPSTPFSFTTVKLIDIPPAELDEYRTVFNDIDYKSRGYISANEVKLALEVNSIHLTTLELKLLLHAMDSAGDEKITFPSFACALYALSLQVGEVLPSSVYAVFPDSEFTAETSTGLLKLRRDIWLILDDPTSSITARIISLLIVLTILLSTVSFCIETLPGIHNKFDHIFNTIETFCVLFFTVEFLLRITCTPSPRTFFLNSLNVIDLLAIIPFYIEKVLEAGGTVYGSPLLRAVRLIRVFRLLKVGRYLRWMQVFGKTLTASIAPLAMLVFIISIAILLFSTVVYFLERGNWDPEQGIWINDDNSPSVFTSIPATFWWCIVTMTTVGYGDTFPITNLGKLMASVTFLSGIMLLAIPISVISGNFHGEYAHMRRLQALKAEHAKQPAPSPLDPLGVVAPELVAPEVVNIGEEIAKKTKEDQQRQALALQESLGISNLTTGKQHLGLDGLGSPPKPDVPGTTDIFHPAPQSVALQQITALRQLAAVTNDDGTTNENTIHRKVSDTIQRQSSNSKTGLSRIHYRTAAQDDKITVAEMELLRHSILERQATSIDVRAVERFYQSQAEGYGSTQELSSIVPDMLRNPHRTKPTHTPKPAYNEELVGNKDPLVDERINRSTSIQTVGSSVIDDGLEDDLGDIDLDNFDEGGNEGQDKSKDYGIDGEGHRKDDPSTVPRSRSYLANYGTPYRSSTTTGSSTLERKSNHTTPKVIPSDTNKDDQSTNPYAGVHDPFDASVVSRSAYPPRESTNLSTLMMNNTIDPNLTTAQMIDAYLNEDDEYDDDYGLTAVEAMIEAQKRIDASWSEPFLRTCLNIVRNSRRSVMSSMKSAELRNREHAVEDIKDFVKGIPTSDKRNLMLGQASRTGLV